MPKPRKPGKGGDTLFSISPWHDKVVESDDQPQDEAYQVVDEQLVQPHSGGGRDGPLPDGAASASMSAAAAHEPLQPAAAEAAAGDHGGGWRVRKWKAEEGDEAPAGTCARADVAAESGGSGLALVDDGQAAPPPEVLEGTAVLAILPNRSITGHLLLLEGRRRSIGLMGEEVLAYRDCTRDTEWRVLRMTAIDFGAGRREATFLVECTEGDAMRLRAPIAWQGMEADTQEALSGGCEAGMGLEFDCSQLLVDAAADAELRRLQPSLCGRCALVNVGHLKLTWPRPPGAQLGADWLGSQERPAAPAAAWHQQQQVGQEEGGGPRAVVSPGLALGPAPPPRKLTSGPGSGRVVRDTGDDW